MWGVCVVRGSSEGQGTVRVCVCKSVRLCVHMCVCVCVFACMCMRVSGCACVCACVCVFEGHLSFKTHIAAHQRKGSETYSPTEGQKWPGLHVYSKPPLRSPVFSLPPCLLSCGGADEGGGERKGREKPPVGGISVKLRR